MLHHSTLVTFNKIHRRKWLINQHDFLNACGISNKKYDGHRIKNGFQINSGDIFFQ